MNAEASPRPFPGRLGSIDAFRGFVMLLLLGEVLRLCQVSAAMPGSVFWRWLCHHQSHVEWVGCSLHDLIQPGFSFLVGVALPFSIARRQARGDAFRQLAWHAGLRSVLLIVCGAMIMLLYSEWRGNWHLEDTLSQIGLAYPFVFVLAFRPARDQWAAVAILLAGCWLWFACTPLPGPEFDYARVGVTAEWLKSHGLIGFGAHWQKNSNPACLFDLWWMNLMPRATPYTGPDSGVNCLNFVPLIATMLLGVRAGDVLHRCNREPKTLRWLVIAGAIGVLAGWALSASGVCPLVKRLWTPSWVLFSGGACFLILGAFHLMVDLWSWSKAAFFLIVIGTNSLVAYFLAHLFPAVAFNIFRRILGAKVFRIFGTAYEPAVYGLVVLGAYWLALYLLHRRKLFLRI